MLSAMMSPGATIFTRMSAGPSSSASDFMNAFSADLAALWADAPNGGRCDTPLEVATMQPFLFANIPGRAAFTQ